MACNVYHHVRQYLHVLLFRLNPYIGNSRVLNGIRHFCRHRIAGRRQYFTGGHIDYILRQNMISDSVPEHQLLIKFISSDFRQIISSGVKKHRIDQAFRTLHAERLARTVLFIQL